MTIILLSDAIQRLKCPQMLLRNYFSIIRMYELNELRAMEVSYKYGWVSSVFTVLWVGHSQFQVFCVDEKHYSQWHNIPLSQAGAKIQIVFATTVLTGLVAFDAPSRCMLWHNFPLFLGNIWKTSLDDAADAVANDNDDVDGWQERKKCTHQPPLAWESFIKIFFSHARSSPSLLSTFFLPLRHSSYYGWAVMSLHINNKRRSFFEN